MLQRGFDHFSQVFLGYVSGSESLSVLKIFDDRYFRMLNLEHVMFDREMATGYKLAENESMAYTRLYDLQGSILPYSYGFWEVSAIPKAFCRFFVW